MGPWVHALITLTSEESQQGSSTLISKRKEHSGTKIRRKRARTQHFSQGRPGIESGSGRINLIYFLCEEICFNKSKPVRADLQWVLRFLSNDICFCMSWISQLFRGSVCCYQGKEQAACQKTVHSHAVIESVPNFRQPIIYINEKAFVTL